MSDHVQVTLGPPTLYTVVDGENVIGPNTIFLSNGTWYPSINQKYVLILQKDGNLVLYEVIGTPPPLQQGTIFTAKRLWATGTDNNQNNIFMVQPDGNLVVYDSGGNPIWESNTYGVIPIGLYLQNDGNLALYKSDLVWASNTNS